MTVNGRRRLRLFFKFGLIVSLPLTGYLWALTGASPAAMALTAACVIMAIGAETLVTVSESHLDRLIAIDDGEERSFRSESAARDEKIRQMDRIVETLSNQNHDLRGKLVSIHGEVHRLQEETAHLGLDQNAEPAGSEADEAPGDETAEVTDITSLRRR